MEDIKLNFINRSNNTKNCNVLIFQQNVAEHFEEIPIAWKVIKNCGGLENHSFVYPINFMVGAVDSYGNYNPLLLAKRGEAFEVIKSHDGHVLQLSSTPSANATEVEVRNNLTNQAISANCYRDGKLLALRTGVASGQKAVFKFQPRIYIGAVVSQVEEGYLINSAILSQINSQINLTGIRSADIVMTGGGGSGTTSIPYNFSLENINQ